MKTKLFTAAVLSLTFALNAFAVDNPSATHPAQVVVEETTKQVVSALKASKDDRQINTLINEIILPHFDFEQMSKWTLGKQWRKLDEDKQTLFVSHFRQLLVNTYTTALVKFDNESIDILKAKTSKNPKIAAVPSRINLKNDDPMIISYMMMDTANGWKVVDMSISGVSLVKNYRATYASEIRKDGFDSLLERLIKKNELAGL